MVVDVTYTELVCVVVFEQLGACVDGLQDDDILEAPIVYTGAGQTGKVLVKQDVIGDEVSERLDLFKR